MVKASLVALLLVPLPAAATAGVVLPPGFTRQVYVTGQGFENRRGALPPSETSPQELARAKPALGALRPGARG